MFRDGVAMHPPPSAVQPRQVATAGSLSTTLSTVASSTITPYTKPVTTYVPHAAVSTVTTGIDLGQDPCTGAIPAGGIIRFNDTYTLFLDDSLSYVGPCGNHTIFGLGSSNSTVIQSKDPFYASLHPQIYALATATVISYLLVILIYITPRTFYVGGPGGSAGLAGPSTGFRTFLPGSRGRNTGVVGIGRRPLLQKIAAITVAISLTIATADTFRVAEKQYEHGFMDSKGLVQEVVGSLEIRITRVISDTFLWLAQVQTLIRLFPRHKEKVTIKWLGFGLVLCDSVFSIVENFVTGNNKTRPESFTDAVPALSYLFELSISLIYASCVLYYALSKRRFAFWHSRMRNVCLVALLSVIAVLIPVVFFITDLAQPDIATWGEYIRWVGAAAASVVVWEWVERIEALERDEKKDGILGREIFDGDEMLDQSPSEDGYDNNQSRRSGDGDQKRSRFWKNVRDLHIDIQPNIKMHRFRKGRKEEIEEKHSTQVNGHAVKSDPKITRPPQAVTPISRSDTNSAASTVYAVRYHDPFSPSPAIPEERAVGNGTEPATADAPPAISDDSTLTNSTDTTINQERRSSQSSAQAISTGRQIWQGVSNPFKRKRAEPPAEVAAQIAESHARRSPTDAQPNLKSKFSVFTAAQRARIAGRSQRVRTPLGVTVIPSQRRASRMDTDTNPADEAVISAMPGVSEQAELSATPTRPPNPTSIPVTIIPAPIRGGRTWSPDDLAHHQQTSRPLDTGTNIEPTNSASSSNDHQSSSIIQSQRGTLIIEESPIRSRDTNTSNNGRTSRNNRSSTMLSIDNRLGSASPVARSGGSRPRPDSTGARGAPTADNMVRPASGVGGRQPD